jgi:TM2 domain-containing membrane protein YozV
MDFPFANPELALARKGRDCIRQAQRGASRRMRPARTVSPHPAHPDDGGRNPAAIAPPAGDTAGLALRRQRRVRRSAGPYHVRPVCPLSPVNFRHKALAALLAATLGALGAHRIYLGQKLWWLPLAVSLTMLPLLFGVRNWYQSPAFFVLMIPVLAGFIEALVIALTPDERFDARFNAGCSRRNRSGWDAVLVAIAALMVGATVLMTTIALLFQTYFEHALGVPH